MPEVKKFRVALGSIPLELGAQLGEMRALQKRVGGLIAVMGKIADRTVTIEEVAAIIYHGAKPFNPPDKVPPIETIEEIIFQYGVLNFIAPCANFISSVLSEGPNGKKETPTTVPAPATGEPVKEP